MLFVDRLHLKIKEHGSPAMVGIDPRLDKLPEPFLNKANQGVPQAAEALTEYNRNLIDILHQHVGIIKPQSAFFEHLGHLGIKALEDLCSYAKEKDLLVLMDAKRGDIGSTSKAYASTFLEGGHLGRMVPSDALTINPYLGEDACEPFIEIAKKESAGLYVLVKTSNPGAETFQNHGTPPLSDKIAEKVAEWGAQYMGENGWSNIGAVIGATRPQELKHFRKLMPQTPFLLPGFGFQGGTAEGLKSAFDKNKNGAIVNSSRGITFAHLRPELKHLTTWEKQTEGAIIEMKEQLETIF